MISAAIASFEQQALFVNKAGRQLVGVESLKQVLSTKIQDYHPPDTWSKLKDVALPAVLQTGCWLGVGQLRNFKTGQLIDVQMSLFLVRHPQNGQPICIATVQRDITERKRVDVALRESEARYREKATQLEKILDELKQTQAHLVHSEKMSSLGQLVAGIAHEINNPVNFIFGNLIHAQQYTKELLHLLALYQQQYPPTQAIQAEIENIELDFLLVDLPKVMNSMKVGAERIRFVNFRF